MRLCYRWLIPALLSVCMLLYFVAYSGQQEEASELIKIHQRAKTAFRKTEFMAARGIIAEDSVIVPPVKVIPNEDTGFNSSVNQKNLGNVIDPRTTKLINSRTTIRPFRSSTIIPRKTYRHRTNTDLLQYVPSVQVNEANCDKLFDNDAQEIQLATAKARANPKVIVPDQTFSTMAMNCTSYRQRYITQTLSDEERDFPIAFSLLMFKDVEQAENLLRSIYTPQNFYCIHIDSKSKLETRNAMTAIADCFDNVFITAKSYDVQWGLFSVLEPELQCMKELSHYKTWKYFINLTGQEYPLKTNLHLVKILKSYNGANNLEGTVKRRNIGRTEFVHHGGRATSIPKSAPPPGIVISKGSVHITVCRGYVDYILNNPIGQQFLEWVKDTGIPDETFFSTLNHSPQLKVPGGYLGEPETNNNGYNFLTRYKNWNSWPFNWPCKGKIVRNICIFGVGDLPALNNRPELFANKFHLDFEAIAYQCMMERHFSLIKQDITGERTIDTTYYELQKFVRNQVPHS